MSVLRFFQFNTPRRHRPISRSRGVGTQKAGFTLIELMLVFVISLVLVSLAVPLLNGAMQSQRLRSSADTVRSLWMEARVKAMEEGQIICLRAKLGGNELVMDRILDAHFTASLSSRSTTRKFEYEGELDPFEKGAFTGEAVDFILRDPSQASEETGTTFVTLPETVFVSDVAVIPDERSAFYLGLTSPGESEIEENMSEAEEVSNQELRLGETAGSDGSTWSAPIFFYPDGTASTGAVLLKNEQGKCIEIRLRGLTGIGKVCETSSVETYAGELDVSRERNVLF